MQKFNKKFKRQNLNKFAKTKSFKPRVQRGRIKAKGFSSKRGFLRAAFRCVRKADFKSASKRPLKSVPFKNILINARTAINSKMVLKTIAKPVNKLPRSPQSILFATFLRRYSTLIKDVVKLAQSDVSSQLYESLRQCLLLAKPILDGSTSGVTPNEQGGNSYHDKQNFHNKTDKFKAVLVVENPTANPGVATAARSANWMPPEQWDKLSRQDRQNFRKKAGKFATAIVATAPVAKDLPIRQPTVAPVRSTNWMPPEQWDKLSQEDRRDFRKKTGKFAAVAVLKKPIVNETVHSDNWIPREQWKKIPKKTRNSFLASIGKLKPKNN